ncbi:hypothetical protein BDV06DRAFT_92031 [Aspergillus oleicola]
MAGKKKTCRSGDTKVAELRFNQIKGAQPGFHRVNLQQTFEFSDTPRKAYVDIEQSSVLCETIPSLNRETRAVEAQSGATSLHPLLSPPLQYANSHRCQALIGLLEHQPLRACTRPWTQLHRMLTWWNVLESRCMELTQLRELSARVVIGQANAWLLLARTSVFFRWSSPNLALQHFVLVASPFTLWRLLHSIIPSVIADPADREMSPILSINLHYCRYHSMPVARVGSTQC